MHPNNELYYTIALTKIPNVGPILAKNLVSYCGSAEQIFREKKSRLLKIPRIGSRIAESIKSPHIFNEVEKELRFVEKNQISVLYYLDEGYPYRLKSFADSPVVLYFKGNGNLNHLRVVSVVGTRRISGYGKELIQQFIRDIKPFDVMVCSGLAYGADTEVHRHCVMEGIPTIGVLGHGLDMVYPSANKKLAQQMLEKGGLCTEFGIDTKPDRENFPMRNRIVAAMSDALVVVETQKQGGSMITADLANGYNKDVFAFPGKVSDPFSSGCHELIKRNKAALIENANDLAENMHWAPDRALAQNSMQASFWPALSDDELAVMTLMSKIQEASMDKFYEELNWTPSKLAGCLLHLEFKGLIRSLPGQRYALNH